MFLPEVIPETNLPRFTIEKHLIITEPFPFLSQHKLPPADFRRTFQFCFLLFTPLYLDHVNKYLKVSRNV